MQHTYVIKSFRDKRTAAVFAGETPKGFPADLVKPARRKLVIVDLATTLTDLRTPPSNHLEALKGNRSGQHSIRINIQWRVCFVWSESHAYDVESLDYH